MIIMKKIIIIKEALLLNQNPKTSVEEILTSVDVKIEWKWIKLDVHGDVHGDGHAWIGFILSTFN